MLREFFFVSDRNLCQLTITTTTHKSEIKFDNWRGHIAWSEMKLADLGHLVSFKMSWLHKKNFTRVQTTSFVLLSGKTINLIKHIDPVLFWIFIGLEPGPSQRWIEAFVFHKRFSKGATSKDKGNFFIVPLRACAV